MSDKLMKATMGKIFERETGEEAHGHSPPAEIHPAVTHGDDHGGNGSHRPVMAFGRRVSEDSGRSGWAYGHHNNQVKDGVIYGDTLLSVKTNRVIDHLHTGGAHIQRRAPTKTDIRNKEAPSRLLVVNKGMSGGNPNLKTNNQMAFGHRVSEDSGRAGWAYGHHNNQSRTASSVGTHCYRSKLAGD